MDAAKYQQIVEYNNKSVGKKVLFSQPWNFGILAGFISRWFMNKDKKAEIDSHCEKFNQMSMGNFVNKAALPLTSLASDGAVYAGASVAACTALSNVVAVVSLASVFADAAGLGTGKCFGAFKAGYYEGQAAFIDPKSPKQPELIC